MNSPTHKLYLDDSGNKEYRDDRSYSRATGETPYFVFAGLLLTPASAKCVELGLRTLKHATFGSPQVEIKANWLRMGKERKLRYLDKFGLTDERLRKFCDETYDLIAGADLQLIACAVNKAEVQAEYGSPYYPPAIAYDCLLQRAQAAMEEVKGQVHVTIDDMSGATKKGRQYRENLQRQHEKLRTHGSDLQRGMMFSRISGLSFLDSSVDERLQLADLVAYAVYRQFVDHGPEWEQHAETLVAYDYLKRLAPRFRNFQGRVQGYGIVKFPLKNRVKWTVTKKEKP